MGRGMPGARIREGLREGRRLAGPRVVLYVLPGPGAGGAGFVASRRVGGAVQRNRARRILREAWRAVAPSASTASEVVFVARRGILRARTQELETEMRDLLRRSGLIQA
jgi:ribonuclease P protein component